MPTFRTGNMWTAFNEVDLFLLTTNSTIKRNGALVMGRGIARQARDRFSGLDTALGQQILSGCGNPSTLLRPDPSTLLRPDPSTLLRPDPSTLLRPDPSTLLRPDPSTLLRTGQGKYGLLVSSRWPAAKLGAFQVKYHYSHAASLELIQCSTSALCAWCAAHPAATVAVNFPGIGYGRLRREDVLPIIMQLPDQVAIWEYSSRDKESAL